MAPTKFFYALIFTSTMMMGQFGPQQVINADFNLANSAIPFDVNNDGYVDVISASAFGNEIVWHQNLDGEGNFGEELLLSNEASTLLEMKLVDVDKDGFKDIIYNTNSSDKIAWIKNLDGTGEFGSEQIISQEPFAYDFNVSDLDNDGDNDVLAVLFNGNLGEILVWFENTDGQETFSEQIIIDDEIFGEYSQISIMDMDGDEDMDIVTGYERFQGPGKLVWYKNIDGSGVFEERQHIHEFLGFSDNTSIGYVKPADINGDQYMDLIFDTYNSDTADYLYWIEHLDGLGNFGDPQLIHEKETTLSSLNAVDLDNDGDNDVLVSFYFEPHSSIAWFENTNGSGMFGTKQTISTQVDRATDANAADLSGDGKLDVVSSSSFDDKIAWYEQGVTFGVEENQTLRFTISPNPSNGIFHIASLSEINQIQLISSLGTIIEAPINGTSIDLSQVASGIYFAKITNSHGYSETQKIIKQ